MHPGRLAAPANLFRGGMLLFLGALAGLAGCDRGPRVDPDGPDAVVLILVDTLRADHLGCYGDEDARTPVLDGLSRQGVRFADVTSHVPVTLPSTCCIVTGRTPLQHGVRDNAGFVLADDEVTLAERFHEAGWRTAAVVASEVLDRETGVAQGFDRYDDDFTGPYPVYDRAMAPLATRMATDRRRAHDVTTRALKAADDLAGKPYFLFVHYFDAHAYYDPPPQFGALHPGHPYDGEISYVDSEIGRLLEGLPAERPLIVVVADHGEGLGEHDEDEHGFLLYQSTLQVPWIAKGPGVPANVVRQDPVALSDVAPTIAASVGLSNAGPPLTGRALDWATPPPSSSPIYAETFRSLLSYDWSHLRALREGELKYIRGPYDELFDLARDPHELSPLDARDPEGIRMRAKIDSMATGDDPGDVIAEAAANADPARAEELQSLGYVSGGASSRGSSQPEYSRAHPAKQLGPFRQRQRLRSMLRYALTLIQGDRAERGLAVVDSAMASGASDAEAHYARGLALRKLERMRESRTELEAALHEDPDFEPALQLVSLGRLHRGDVEGAYPLLRHLADLRPTDAEVNFNAGLAAQKLGHREAALDLLRNFLELAPNDRRRSAVQKLVDELAQGG